ncbi:hypothetical protein C627_05260 [Corynebacterium glutamicum ZL-6]|uniref:hypothetical protein n=1 Tax=Corynebacterium TaxID=1716 RepID=UPI0008074B84|nr:MULTISPECIES: hypothetical protein [Corynebacterium]ANR62034.1 hypothetical protein C628_05280 [[Brevibacterium] flavum ZL-1]ANR65034.1 hypothetical protein C627_05260 [Corynebacterium glutamicum ZL-6]PST76468.1 hypothetical protein I919_05342 [Corynebacterium glutamicum ZL-2]
MTYKADYDLDLEKVVFRMSQLFEDLIPSENAFDYYDKSTWPTLTMAATWVQDDCLLIVFRVEESRGETFVGYFSRISPRYNPDNIEFGAVELMYADSIAGDWFIEKVDLKAPQKIHWRNTHHSLNTPADIEELLDYANEIPMWLNPDLEKWM